MAITGATVKIEGTENLLRKLRALVAKEKPRQSVVVGYTAAYAVWVHERREMKLQGQPRPRGKGVYWGPNGRAGFLLDVAREMRGELARIIVGVAQKGVPLIRAILVGGLRLQRQSQLNVPVVTGNLKNSAFTRIETN